MDSGRGNTLVNTMHLVAARELARKTADDTNTPTVVFKTDIDGKSDYDVAFSCPSFATQVGDAFQPVRKWVPSETGVISSGGGSGSHMKAEASTDV